MAVKPLKIEFTSYSGDVGIGQEHVLKKKTRAKYSIRLNETLSLVDNVCQDLLDPCDLGDSIHKSDLVCEKVPSRTQITEDYRERISEHVERRVAFFFQQIITCYQTKLHFELNGALDQAESPEKFTFQDKNKKSLSIIRNAAHSSTTPCLIAYNPIEWNQYLIEKDNIYNKNNATESKKPRGFIFLKDTDSYRLWNSTINMPRWVNEADIFIDGTSNNRQLRGNTLKLINQAAQGELTPEKGLEQFFDSCLSQIQSSLKKYQSDRNKKNQCHVLRIYQEVVRELKGNFENNQDNFLSGLLNLRLDPNNKSAKLKQVIYQIRYRAIRDSQIAQSKLIQKVEAVRQRVLKSYIKKPVYFDGAFRTLLVNQATTDQNRQCLEKLYNFSDHDYQLRTRLQQFTKTKEKIKKDHLQSIKNLAKELLSEMRHLRTEEERQRSLITKELRCAKDWTQKDLGKNIKKHFKQAATSQSTISRIENRRKLVNKNIAQQLSKAFEVDGGLFMPHFFYA